MPSIIWAILAVLLFIVQFSTGIFDLLFLAVAALAIAGASALIPGFASLPALQIVLFVAASFGSLVFFRKRFKQLFRGDELKQLSDEHAGKIAHVTEEILPGQEGRISFQGTTWSARSHDEILPVGATVTILEQSDAVFLVTAQALDDSGPAKNQISHPKADK